MSLPTLLRSLGDRILEPSDAIVDSWPVSNNPSLIFGILGTYVIFVTKVGPMWMKDRKPFDLKMIMMVYNLLQVLACGTMVIVPFFIRGAIKTMISVGCAGCEPHGTDYYYLYRSAGWYYLLMKLIDLLDTVFMVLRRKQNQVTFLHVYHHVSITLISLLYLRWTYGEHLGLPTFMNSLVHVVMYFYYFLAGLGPEMQKKLWWKKYITTLQIVQFLVAVTAYIVNLSFNCEGNKLASVLSLTYAGFYVYLFGKFYYKAYVKKKDKIK